MLGVRTLGVLLIASATVVAGAGQARGSLVTADAVVSYVAGTGAKTAYWGAALNDPTQALGLPASNHNVPDIYSGASQVAWADQTVLSPFNAAYAPNEVVSFGAGGELTLHLSAPVPTYGTTLGVHTGSGLQAVYPSNGVNLAVAQDYTDPRVANVDISADGASWYSLGSVNFWQPSNYYTAGLSGGFDNGPGTAVADFTKPFAGQLSDFNGKDWAGTLGVLGVSAGGTWLDLSKASGAPAAIQYVRFSLPADSSDAMVVDAVTGTTSLPEPGIGLVAIAGVAMAGGRRRTK